MSTTATLTPKPDNQLWGIDYTYREYAHLLGDPLRTVIEAPTKRAAEEAAGKLGFESPWAHPRHDATSRAGAVASSTQKSTATILHAQAITRHPLLAKATT